LLLRPKLGRSRTFRTTFQILLTQQTQV
jgi:hypothetical protein